MLDILYAFGIGLGFAGGVLTGVLIYKSANKPGFGDRSEPEKWDIHREVVEQRLLRYVTASEDIAHHLGEIKQKYLSKKDGRGLRVKAEVKPAEEAGVNGV